MKIYKLLTALALLIIIGFTACTPDNPNNFDIRDDFVGTWLCSEQSSVFGNSNYTVDIVKSVADSSQILIKNFYQLGSTVSVTAVVNGNSLNIPNQNASGQTINGSGSLVSGNINLTYTANDGSHTDNVTATYSQ